MRREKTEVTQSTSSAGPTTLTWLPRTETMAPNEDSTLRKSESAGPMSRDGSTESGMVSLTRVGSMQPPCSSGPIDPRTTLRE